MHNTLSIRALHKLPRQTSMKNVSCQRFADFWGIANLFLNVQTALAAARYEVPFYIGEGHGAHACAVTWPHCC